MALHGKHGDKMRGILSAICFVGLGTGCSPSVTPTTQAAPPAATPNAGINTPAAPNNTTPPATTPVTTTPASAPATPPAGFTPTPPAIATPTMPAAGGAPAPTMPMTPTTPTMMPVPGKLALGECNIKTKYAGDEYCILPPPPDKGFQMHIGPKDPNNPEAQYILQPGQEITSDFGTTGSNDKQIYFYYRQYRQRTGAHHNIITSGSGGDSGLGQRIATFNVLAEDYPKGGLIAPENKDVGISLGAHASINVSLHSINTTEKPQLREVWVNFWYKDAAEVKEPVKEVFAIAPMGVIAPGADVKTNGSCSVAAAGRMLWAYGHRHANTVNFTIWRQRGGMKDLVYQSYNWEDVLQLEYASNVMNPVADMPMGTEGGWSGILDTKPGDQFVWTCHVINKQNTSLAFTNNTYTGEMCILDSEMVGGGCN
jgi:hypothetical protein